MCMYAGKHALHMYALTYTFIQAEMHQYAGMYIYVLDVQTCINLYM